MTLEQQVVDLTTKVDALTIAVAALAAPTPVDLSAVLQGIADIKAQITPAS